MFKRLLLSALLLATNALALPSDNNGGPLANIESGRAYIRSTKPTMFIDPDYVGSDRENLLVYSADFSNAAWLKSGVTASTVTATASAGSSGHRFSQSITGVAPLGNVVRVSFKAKAGTYSLLGFYDTAGSLFNGLNISLDTATINQSVNIISSSVSDADADGYRLYTFNYTVEGTSSDAGLAICLTDSAARVNCNNNWTAAGTETILIKEIQSQRASQNAIYTETTATPVYGPSPGITSVNVVSSINTLYGSTAAFTQATDANKPVLSRPDRVENVVINSEVLGSPTRATVAANSTTNPVNGATTADTCIEDATVTSSHYCLDSANMVSGETYRLSLYAKPKERTFLAVRFQAASGALNDDAYFNLTDCTVGTKGADIITSTAVSAGDGWCKLEMTAISSATGTGYLSYQIADSISNYSYSGDGASGLYLFGRQLQRSSMQPTYIATTTVPVYGSLTGRRMLTFDGSNDALSSTSKSSDIFGTQAKEAFVVMHTNALNVNQYYFTGFDNYWAMRVPSSGSTIGMLNYDGTTDQANTSAAANTTYVANFYHDTTNIGHRLNNGAFTTTASGASSNLNNVLWIGQTGAAGAYFNGQLGPIITYNRVLTQYERDMIRQILQKFWRVG